VNTHALEVLEFEAVLQAVGARAGSALGREALEARRPGVDTPALRRELVRVARTLEVHRRHPGWAPPAPPDARRALRVLGLEGAVLEGAELLVILRLVEASGTLARELPERLRSPEAEGNGTVGERGGRGTPGAQEAGEASPAPLGPLLRLLVRDPAEEDRIRGVVDEEGMVRDGASPALRQLRKRIRSARSRIVRRIEAWAASLPERIRVADASVSLRDGRYVIQVRREGRGEVGGVVHGESGSGGTLFVEPPLALELMNEILELERDEAREVQRILREVTGRLRPRRQELEGALAALVDFDTLWARALAADRWDAHLPELVGPDEESDTTWAVTHGRHPLLLEAVEGGGEARAGEEAGARGEPSVARRPPVVPFDLLLEPGERALVISGPNTGGKTVFLKAMGLLPLLAQSGILPPVGPGTRLPVLRNVFADIGDEQSIERSLSTFSAHLAHAREIVEEAGPATLVLLDEMGTGTDPAEGAALARAILETLVEGGARVLATSHLGAMKRLDTEGSGIVNASLLFDAERIAPTYRFRKGRPGRSYGLAIARRLGFPGAVLDRAEGYVDSGELEVETLLASLEAREEELARALEEARLDRDAAAGLRATSEALAARLKAREADAEARAREEARRYLLEARGEVEAAIRELRAADAEARDTMEREARRRVEAAARDQEELRPRQRRPRGGRKARSRGEPVAPGDRARILGSGARGVVREVEGDRVMVEVGSLRFAVALHEVERIEGQESPGEQASRGGRGQVMAPEVEARTEVHLLGLRVDEVEMALGRALDGAVVAHLPSLRIVHGKGTGAVRARVHELLRRDPRVAEFRGGVHGEGGAGVTVAVLR
jgi:DNA mismatch repair protein MutS2